ncbi:MAG: recombinase family protein [Bryobacterales bacterium]|nr:recombinase family protein [Bryobacterales bacterium]
MKSKRAVGYIRVAAPEQANPRRGLDAQVAAIRSVAEAADIELLRVFEDSGVSAHDARCPGLLALLAAVEAGLVDVVIVPDLSRLARDAEHLQRFRETLDRHSVRLIAADEHRRPTE